MGFSAYARAIKDEDSFTFAKNLGESVYVRYMSGNYRSLPYPVPPDYLPHARPMILTNMLCELYRAACLYDPEYAGTLSLRIAECRKDVFQRFQDSEHLIHEFVYRDGSFAKNLFGQHINPGHTLEDMWFQMEASDILKDYRYDGDIEKIVLSTLEAGWDTEYKGLLHFVPCDGLNTRYQPEETAEEPQMKLVLDDWGSKLWWVHSEAMYTTLKMYFRTGKAEYADWFKKVFDYTYQVFPNSDRSIREWIQIRTREGKPQDKVVALPVKDPYHIIRNVLLIIELLEERKGSENGKSDVC
jgi:N-acylglucosamine 2-epimerase